MTDSKSKAAILVIGDEILAGRIQDTNTSWLASQLGLLGIAVGEARVVPDIEEEIVAAVNALRTRYKYVFCTGGIGPTHDDITTASVAKAFGVPVEVNKVAYQRLLDRIGAENMNEAREKMTQMPVADITLIEHIYDAICGFRLENVFVMAGIPRVAQSMFTFVAPMLESGLPLVSGGVFTLLKEGDIAVPLGQIQKNYPTVAIGSYPQFDKGETGIKLIARGTDPAVIDVVLDEIRAIIIDLGDTPQELPQAV